ncbi:hypothetical protein [Agrobacterium burrii]|uniref:Lipoprotein n=1 Tax=Agrobacterium burrii TaxID=2815339 RepID=A0ABS3EJZ0_9HYPH|nr:hypothetical protein [Agrobacterium burrii]MBO0132289.1 hypothetical protein [Agrobacterium burrii]
MRKSGYLIVAGTMLSGCTNVPAFDLTPTEKAYGSPIVRVASIMANLKCELWDAANSHEEMPQFLNDPSLRLADRVTDDESRKFTMKNIFGAIAYVGEVELTIDATQTTGSNPSLSFPGLGSSAHPFEIGVNAEVSQKGHRSNTTYHSVDFERLVAGSEQPPAAKPSVPCGQGRELAGRIGLEENLKMGLVASSMNDISVWPKSASYPNVSSTVEDKYTGGQIHAVIDFTTTMSVSGGPSWELKHFEGPNSDSGLFNHRREALNQVAFTFLPVCIRDAYAGTRNGTRWEYKPKLPHGTPAWANYLPPCRAPGVAQRKNQALNQAHDTNIRSLDNIRFRAF